MKKNLLTCLLVTTFLTSNVFARGTYYVGEESDNYVINLGGDNAENMVSYENKVKVDNLSGNDSITIKNAIFEDLYDDATTATGATPYYGTERGGAVSTLAPINEITNSIFKNNIAKPTSGFAYGGALHVQQVNIGLITDSIFEGNQAISDAQSRAWGGAIHSNRSNFEGIINSSFTNNIAQTNSSQNPSEGGAIAFNGGRLEKIENSTFVGNKSIATGGGTAYGGAVLLYSAGMGDILNTTFENNYSEAYPESSAKAYAQGGALSLITDVYNIYDGNEHNAVRLYADFSNNYAKATYNALGGAFFLSTKDYQPDIRGTYNKNYADGDNYAGGGAIWISSEATVKNIESTFTQNYVKSKKQAYGGAIDNRGIINNINSDFTGNYSISDNLSLGGGIINYGTIDNITGNFTENYVIAQKQAAGGGVVNFNNIGNIGGTFTGNDVKATNNSVWAGAIYNDGEIDSIVADFTNNHIKSSNKNSYGGAITNYGTINNISGSFIDNKATSESEEYLAYGGAIQTETNIAFSSGGEVRFMSGNYTQDNIRDKIYNAIFVSSYEEGAEQPTININTNEGGAWVINDNIEGGADTDTSVDYTYQYDLLFTGTDTVDEESGSTDQYINMNNAIVNAKEISVSDTTLRLGKYNHEDKTANNWEGQGKIIAMLNSDGTENLNADAVTSLSLDNGVFDISNGYLEKINLKNYKSNNGFLHLDIDTENLKSDVLNINGNVEGTTTLVLHASSGKYITGSYILFAQSENDTQGSINSFKVGRVYKSPYLYDIVIDREEDGIDTTHSWELTMNDKDNPNKDTSEQPENLVVKDKIVVTPEVMGSISLPNASVSQSSGMIYNVMRKIGVNKVYCPGCGFYDYNWDGKSIRNVWADTTYNGLKINTPVEVEAKVWGIEAGADLQQDINNKLGFFVSYRKGNYDMEGKGEKYVSTIDTELDIDSYVGGLYYRYDNGSLYTFSTVYGGIQDAEISTGDGISNDTEGIEFGASAEIGYSQALSKTTYVTPSLSVFYSYIDYDDVTDDLGKTTKYHSLNQVEVEAGVKLSKAVYTEEGFYSVYAKPSVVQTYVKGDEINITKLGKVDTLDNQTLGRMEVGGKYSIGDHWSTYGWANYTFGSDYKATSLGFGLNYSW